MYDQKYVFEHEIAHAMYAAIAAVLRSVYPISAKNYDGAREALWQCMMQRLELFTEATCADDALADAFGKWIDALPLAQARDIIFACEEAIPGWSAKENDSLSLLLGDVNNREISDLCDMIMEWAKEDDEQPEQESNFY